VSAPATKEISDWLEKLGMPEYGECFAENKIDLSVLPHLTDQDLKDIGVPLGADNAGGYRRPCWPTTGIAETSRCSGAEGARCRRATADHGYAFGPCWFDRTCGRMDPEDLREVISAYQKCVAETVRRFGGFVAKYMGDGVLVYFG
jgi:SAM (Sterile alpha motif) domain-containing protein